MSKYIKISEISSIKKPIKMKKILFYSHTIDFAGTWRSHERILLNLDKNLSDYLLQMVVMLQTM